MNQTSWKGSLLLSTIVVSRSIRILSITRILIKTLLVSLLFSAQDAEAEPQNFEESVTKILLLEQGFSLFRDRNRYPLWTPFEWQKDACIIAADSSGLALVETFFRLTAEITGNRVSSLPAMQASSCPVASDLFVLFSTTPDEALNRILVIDTVAGTSFSKSVTVEENEFDFAAIDFYDEKALVSVIWNAGDSEEWRNAILIQELFQVYTGGNDVNWQGEFFSILHEVDPDPAAVKFVANSSAWKSAKLEQNAVGLCSSDIFVVAALSSYTKHAKKNLGLPSLSSRNLLNHAWENRATLMEPIELTANGWNAYELILDRRCW